MKTLGCAFLVLGALVASGCTTVEHRPLPKETSTALQGRTVVVTRYAMPDFTAMTPTKAAFGLVGAALMVSEGNALIKDNEIPDPAVGIAAGLSGRLAEARAMKPSAPGPVATTDEVPALVTLYKGGDYLLDVKTINWMFHYYPSNWTGYRVTYIARMRLIDAASGKVVAESACRTTQGNDATPPSQDQLLANRAALLKEYLQNATRGCIDVLAKDVLQLSA